MVELARLPGNAGDAEPRRLIINSFGIAQLLHSNSYENRGHEDGVLVGLMLCEEPSERLYALFWRESAAVAVAAGA